MAGQKRLLVFVGKMSERDRHGFRERFVSFFWGYRREDGRWSGGWSHDGVRIRFQSDDDRRDYGPRVSFEPSEANARIATRICKVLRWDTKIAELIQKVKAIQVEHDPEDHQRYLEVQENVLIQLARVAH